MAMPIYGRPDNPNGHQLKWPCDQLRHYAHESVTAAVRHANIEIAIVFSFCDTIM